MQREIRSPRDSHPGNKRWLGAAVVTCLLAGVAGAKTIHVSATGQDESAGTEHAPLRTIQKAADAATPGDVVIVHAGIYRETVTVPRSGEPGHPITYRAAPGEHVVINGTEPVVGWRDDGHGAYTAAAAADFYRSAFNFADQVFVDGQALNFARWPNASSDLSNPKKSSLTKFISKTRDNATNWTTSVFEDDQLLPKTDDYYVGCQIMIQPNYDAWSWTLTGEVIAQKGNRLTIRSRSNMGKDGKQDVYDDRSRYYLFGARKLLDADGEFFHDVNVGQIVVRMPDGSDPATHQVEMRRRDMGFILDGKSYIAIQGFELFACSLTTDMRAGDGVGYDLNGAERYPWRSGGDVSTSHHILIDGISVKYPSHFTDMSGHFFLQWGTNTGLVVSGSNQTIQNCHIQFSAGNGISCQGRDNKILNNLIEDVSYQQVDCSGINTCGTTDSYDTEIGYNTIRRTGRSGITPRGLTNTDVHHVVARIHHNDVGEFMLQDWDGGGMYAATHNANFARVDHNWWHDGPGHTTGGVYIDFEKNWIIDHNVIWNVDWAVHLEGAHTSGVVDALVYNNSAYSTGSFIGIGNGQAPGSFYMNNVANRGFGKAEGGAREVRNNLIWDGRTGSETDPKWKNPTGGDLLTTADSPMRDHGVVVPSLSTQQPGNADIVVPSFNDPSPDGKPDLGAYEFGTELWTAGSTLKTGIKVPSAPGTLVAIAVGANQVNLQWADESTNESGFIVERSLAGGAFEAVAQVAANASEYNDAGLTRLTKYAYRVKAVNSAGESAATPDAVAITPAETAADAKIPLVTASESELADPQSKTWKNATIHEIANPIGDDTKIKTAAECSATWKATWDDIALHILVDVTDNSVHGDAAAPWYSQSGVEIYFDADNSKRKGYDGLNDYQIGVTAADGVIHFGASAAPRRDGIVASATRTATGYRVRIDLPWTTTLGRAQVAGALVGLDVHINHTMDGKSFGGKRAWYADKHNLSWMDASRFATVELVAP